LPGLPNIQIRPPEAEAWQMPGYREADLIMAMRNQSVMVVRVRRRRRFVILTRLGNHMARGSKASRGR